MLKNSHTRFLVLLGMTAAVVAGCSEEEIVFPDGLTPSLAKSEGRIELPVAEASEISFTSTDRISVISSRDIGNNIAFDYDETSSCFVGDGVMSDTYCMIYPFQKNVSIYPDGGQFIISAELSSDQTDYPGMYVSAGNMINPYPAHAIARITIDTNGEDTQIDKVELSSLGSESLSGPVSMIVSPNIRPLIANNGQNSATVYSTKSFSTGQKSSIDLFVIPQELSSGYKISVTDGSGVATVAEFPELTVFDRGNVTELGPVEISSMPEFYIEYTASEEIKIDGYLTEFADGKGRIYFSSSAVPENLLRESGSKLALTGLVIPANITEIDDYAFHECSNLASVVFAENSSLTRIGGHAFQSTGIASIAFPESLQILDELSFDATESLKTISFGENSNLSRIETGVFRNTVSLENVTIPATLEFLGKNSFSAKFKTPLEIHFLGQTPPAVTNNAKDQVFNDKFVKTIYVPAGSSQAYIDEWKGLKNAAAIAKLIVEE